MPLANSALALIKLYLPVIRKRPLQNPLPQLLHILSSTPNRWRELANCASELLGRAPAPGEWSAIECLNHLIDTERDVFPGRVRAILAGQDFPTFNPASQDSQASLSKTPYELAEEFSRLRRASLNLLATLSLEDLSRTARHEELGPVNLGQLLHEWAAHDLDHTIQAERALMQPFIQGCGPWQVYFRSNIIS
jgi:hypothetical protein